MDNEYFNFSLFLTFLLHLSFGFIGAKFERFSRAWGRCLYIPIVMTILIRRITGISYSCIPFFIVFALGGQTAGRILRRSGFDKKGGSEEIPDQAE